MQIVNFWYNLARQNKAVNAFAYGKRPDNGAGNERFPLTHLDDPVLGGSAGETLTYTCNVDITGVPDAETSVKDIQAAAFLVGLSYWQKARQDRGDFRITSFTFITLREYYDNDAAGVRFTYQVAAAIPLDQCAEYFDNNKEFLTAHPLPDFSTDAPEGCAVFSQKGGLPNFKIDV